MVSRARAREKMSIETPANHEIDATQLSNEYRKTRTAGLYVRHSRSCPAYLDEERRCRCEPSYRTRRRIDGKARWSPVFKDRASAVSWDGHEAKAVRAVRAATARRSDVRRGRARVVGARRSRHLRAGAAAQSRRRRRRSPTWQYGFWDADELMVAAYTARCYSAPRRRARTASPPLPRADRALRAPPARRARRRLLLHLARQPGRRDRERPAGVGARCLHRDAPRRDRPRAECRGPWGTEAKLTNSRRKGYLAGIA